jgi:hypothetical protein
VYMLYREFNKINCMFKLDFNPLGLDCVVFHEIYVYMCLCVIGPNILTKI